MSSSEYTPGSAPGSESARPEVEGHLAKGRFMDQGEGAEVEGHGFKLKFLDVKDPAEVEGHGFRWKLDQGPGGDALFEARPVDEAGNQVEGHATKVRFLDVKDPGELDGQTIRFEDVGVDDDGAVVGHAIKIGR